jgi:hypothetical protein
MDIDGGVQVRIRLIVTRRAPEQLSPFLHDASACSVGEPLPRVSASGAILTGTMGIDFDGDHRCTCIGFLARVLPDLPAQLVGEPTVHAPGFICPFRPDLAQALKEQNTPGYLAQMLAMRWATDVEQRLHICFSLLFASSLPVYKCIMTSFQLPCLPARQTTP